MLRLALMAAALLQAGPLQAEPAQSALDPAGIQAGLILDLWHFTLALCALVFVAIVVATLAALWRAPRGSAATAPDLAPTFHDEPVLRRNVMLAVAISALLLFVLLVASVYADRALARLPLGDALHIELVGHQWWWEANYDDDEPARTFTVANELHIPVGRAVILTLKSADVIHSFWVPALHGKKDLLPGRSARIQLRADRPGIYRGQCAEFCGHGHALMGLVVVAEATQDYEAWAERQRQPAAVPDDAQQQRGLQVFLSSTCAMCHRINGTTAGATLGPDLTHLASRATLAAATLPNQRSSLASWIVDPHQSKPGVNMPAHVLGDDDLEALLAYLGSLE